MTDSLPSRNHASELSERSGELSASELEDVVSRVLARARSRNEPTATQDDDAAAPRAGHERLGRARELVDEEDTYVPSDGDQQDLAERHALRRVAGLSTELEDVTEVEYRQLLSLIHI